MIESCWFWDSYISVFGLLEGCMGESKLSELMPQLLNLSPQEKIRLIARLADTLEHDLEGAGNIQRESLYGLCADLGAAPSAQDIDEVRHAAWGNFPRGDIR
jgi:hypothetical protein